MSFGEKNGSKGSAGCGCSLLFVVLVAWGICFLIFPKLPDYEEAMEGGEQVPGKVIRVETVENVKINGRHPRRVIFSYGDDGQEGSMMMAMGESASKGQAIQVRVTGEHAYPDDIRPFARPHWLNYALIGGALLGVMLLGLGVLRLLFFGGVIFAAGRSLRQGKQSSPPPPPSSPPPPPPPPPNLTE